MSFMDMLKKLDKAIDQGLKVADEKTAFIDKAEVFVCRGKTADERCDQGVDMAAVWARDKAMPVIRDKASFVADKARAVKDKAVSLGGKAKEKITHKTECVADVIEEIEIIVDTTYVVPMAKIIDVSHKVPQMNLKSDKAVSLPIKARMDAFVENAKDNTPFAEMR